MNRPPDALTSFRLTGQGIQHTCVKRCCVLPVRSVLRLVWCRNHVRHHGALHHPNSEDEFVVATKRFWAVAKKISTTRAEMPELGCTPTKAPRKKIIQSDDVIGQYTRSVLAASGNWRMVTPGFGGTGGHSLHATRAVFVRSDPSAVRGKCR